MTENKFIVTCKVTGSKIKSKIKGYIETNYPEMSQGQDDFRVKVHLEFEEGDIPKEVNVSLERPDGFEEVDAINLKPETQDLEFEILFKYVDAPVGYYTAEGLVIHEEYGTELGKIEGSYFYLKVPEMSIESCAVSPDVVRSGDKFDVKIVLKTTSPQKVKGAISGKLKPAGDTTSARVYELEMQKISVKAEREVTWELRVPRDEENIAGYNCQFKFESKEAQTEASFDDVFKLKHTRDIQVLELVPEVSVASPEDNVSFKCRLKNIGIEPTEISAKITIDGPEGEKMMLDSQRVEIEPDEETESVWKWSVPVGSKYGFYQYGVEWEFANTGEQGEMPGNVIEIKPRHHLEITSATTDKDYYLSGQKVRFNLLIIDSGTRAGMDTLDIQYKIGSRESGELHGGSFNSKVETSGTELNEEWTIPTNLESGALDFNAEIRSGEQILTERKFSNLINVEQPVSIKFNLIQSSIVTHSKEIEKYVFDGEYRVSEELYQDLRIINLSSETQMMICDSKLVGGIAWHKLKPDKRRQAEDLIFSKFLLNNAINAESLAQLRRHWNELGALWASKLRNAVLDLSSGAETGIKMSNQSAASGGPELAAKIRGTRAFKKLKGYIKRSDIDTSRWQDFIQPLLAPVNFVENKALVEMLEKVYGDKHGRSMPGIALEYLELGKIQSPGKLAEVMNDFIKKLYLKVSSDPAKNIETITKSLEGWYTYYRNVQIEIEHDQVITDLINVIYSLAALKLITRILNTFDSIIKKSRVTRMDYIRHTFYLFNFHMLNIEYQQKIIRYNEFLNEELSKEELTRQFSLIEELALEQETILGRVMRFYKNHFKNMELRRQSALIRNNIKLTEDTDTMNGFMGENIKHNLELTNQSRKDLKLNLLFSFPSADWHMLEPECNLIDGVYWQENLFIPAGKKYKLNMAVTFPKTLAYQDYKCLLKLEPVSIKLLNEK
jgi:hypothetical protein